jgi:hypothetical protein
MILCSFGFVPLKETLPLTWPVVDGSIGVGAEAVVSELGCSDVSSDFFEQPTSANNVSAVHNHIHLAFVISVPFCRNQKSKLETRNWKFET